MQALPTLISLYHLWTSPKNCPFYAFYLMYTPLKSRLRKCLKRFKKLWKPIYFCSSGFSMNQSMCAKRIYLGFYFYMASKSGQSKNCGKQILLSGTASVNHQEGWLSDDFHMPLGLSVSSKQLHCMRGKI